MSKGERWLEVRKETERGIAHIRLLPHHNLATLIIIWSFILSQVLSSIFVSWERVVKNYSAHPLHSLVPLIANGVKCEDLFTLVVLLYLCNLTQSAPRLSRFQFQTCLISDSGWFCNQNFHFQHRRCSSSRNSLRGIHSSHPLHSDILLSSSTGHSNNHP